MSCVESIGERREERRESKLIFLRGQINRVNKILDIFNFIVSYSVVSYSFCSNKKSSFQWPNHPQNNSVTSLFIFRQVQMCLCCGVWSILKRLTLS